MTTNYTIADVFTYTWAIENCSKLITPDGILSPAFEVNFLENTKWALSIKNFNQQFFSYYIQRQEDGGPDSIEVFFVLSFLSADGLSLKEVRRHSYFRKCGYLEYAALTEYVFELHRLQYLVNDTLTLRCRMFKIRTDGMSEQNLCFARTRLGLERRTFMSDIRNFSTFQPGRDVKHQIESAIEGALPLVLAFNMVVVDGIDRLFGIAAIDADCCAVEPGFESRRRHGCLYSTSVIGDTLNSRPAASPLVKLVEGEERWEPPDHPQRVLPQNWGGTKQNRSLTCMVLKAKANDRRKNVTPCHGEFRRP
ncbi:speckle-type POZ protein [Trichonephila clavipes]|nr:speckle-type POZ protein [Trichonephila clavipes]